MRFRIRGRCDGCGEEISGVNCLPLMDFRCHNCGAEIVLCTTCQSTGLDCLVCEDKLEPAWTFREGGRCQTHQRTIVGYI